MGILAPYGVNSNLKDIFDMKMPAFSDDDDGSAIPGAERHVVSPELMAYLKFLIYTAAFKDPLADKRGAEHVQYYLRWTLTFAAHEDVYRKQLLEALEIWYDMFPPTKRRARSLLGAGPPSLAGVALLDNPEFDVPIRSLEPEYMDRCYGHPTLN